MGAPTFHFTAQFPAHGDSLEPLDRLIAHVLEYVGVPASEAMAEASRLASEVGHGLRGAAADKSIEVRFEKDAERLEIAISAPDAVHRLVRQLPAA